MPSEKKHRKGATKKKDEDNTYKKFSCEHKSKHPECDGTWIQFPKRDPQGAVKWTVKWAPCQENNAVEFMKEKHGYIFNRHSRHENDSKPEKKHSRKKHPALHDFFYSASRPSPRHIPAKVASGKHNTQAQAAGHPRNERREMPPPTLAETRAERDAHGAMILEMLQRESRDQEVEKQRNDQRVDAWMAEQEGLVTAMPSNQSTVPPPGMALNRGMVPPQRTYTAGTGNMCPAPMIPSPQDARPGEKHQKRRHQKSSNKNGPEQEPQPSTAVSPPATPDGGEHRPHRSRHPKAKPEQEQQPSTAIQPPRMMLTGMASPRGMVVPPQVPSTQGPTIGQHQRHLPVRTSHYSHGPPPPPPAEAPAPMLAVAPAPVAYPPQTPPDGQRPHRRHQKSSQKPEAGLGEARQPPAVMIPPPGSMPTTMANLAGGAMSVPRPGGPQGYSDVHTAGPSNKSPLPPPMDTTMPGRPAAEEMSLLPAAQPGPGVPTLPRTHLFPTTAPPQAGVIVVTADGAPGPQATRARSSRRGAPPKADMAMQPRPRMEPTPMSMPRFPGAGPGTPVPFDPSLSPPPSAPTPPVPDGALD